MNKRFLSLLWFLIPGALIIFALSFYWDDIGIFDSSHAPMHRAFFPLLFPLFLSLLGGAVLLMLKIVLYKKTGIRWISLVLYPFMFALSAAIILPTTKALIGLPRFEYNSQTILSGTPSPFAIVPALLVTALLSLIVCFVLCAVDLTLHPYETREKNANCVTK